MTTLAFDPGTAHIGYAVLRNGDYATSGTINANGGLPWPLRLRAIRASVAQLLATWQPDVVGIEATQVHEGQWERAKTDPKALAGLRSQARLTRQTEELAGEIRGMAEKCGAVVLRPTPEQGRMRLGVKRGAKDREYSEAATRIFRLVPPLKVKAHHEARALGVAMQATMDAEIGRRTA